MYAPRNNNVQTIAFWGHAEHAKRNSKFVFVLLRKTSANGLALLFFVMLDSICNMLVPIWFGIDMPEIHISQWYQILLFAVCWCWHKQFSILLPSKVNHIDSVISSHLGRSRLDDKKEYFKISCAIELFNWNYRRLKMVNNGYLTWHQRNHGIVSFPFKHKHTPSPSPSPSSSKHLDNQTKRQWNVMWHIIRTIRFFISILLKA